MRGAAEGGELGFSSARGVFLPALGVHSLAWDCGTQRERCVQGRGKPGSPGFGSLPRSPLWGILQGCNPVSNVLRVGKGHQTLKPQRVCQVSVPTAE